MNSGPIQIIPPGLLGFFQLKNNGQNPQWMPDVLQPVIDLREWYLQARSTDLTQVNGAPITVTPGAGTVGGVLWTSSDITTPSNEWWWVEHYSVTSAVLAAADVVSIACCIWRPFTGNPNFYVNPGFANNPSGVISGAATSRRAHCSSNGFWLAPQSRLGLWLNQNEGAGVQFTAYVRYTPCPS